MTGWLIDAEPWRAGYGRNSLAAVVDHDLFNAVRRDRRVRWARAGRGSDATRAGWSELLVEESEITLCATSSVTEIWIAGDLRRRMRTSANDA